MMLYMIALFFPLPFSKITLGIFHSLLPRKSSLCRLQLLMRWLGGRNVCLHFSSDSLLIFWPFFEYPNCSKQGETFKFVLGKPPCGAFYQMTPWQRTLKRGINEVASEAAVGSHGINPPSSTVFCWIISSSSDTDYIKKIVGHVMHSGFLYFR